MRTLLATLLVVLSAPVVAEGAVNSEGATTLTYDHDGEDLLQIDFPAGWVIDTDYVEEAKAAGAYTGGEPEIRIVEAMPTDGTRLYFGVWVAPRTTTLDKGLEYADSLDGSLFTEVEATEPKATELGGMPARTFHGTAKRQGDDVEFAMAILEAREGVIVAVLYVGVPDSWAKHQEELEAIVGSIRPAGS